MPEAACGNVSAREAGWAAVSAAFGSLGRVFITLGCDFKVRHVSQTADAMAGRGAAQRMTGLPIEDVLGIELFGPGGALRRAVLLGERREGWRASMRVEPFGSRLVSVSTAPLRHDPSRVCDPEVCYIVVLRPAEQDVEAAGPTGFGGVIARSRAMSDILRLVSNLEHSEATVIITGESGTGKEVVARAIHRHSPRRDGPFVAVNCGAIPAELLESELFGHVRGAFTGAVKDRVGRFEAAAGGTLLLDEIAEMPSHLQVKLLRVLQEHTYNRVGETQERTTDARILAATNADVTRAVQVGRFREDLYYRLRVVPIELPPLRERPEDIEPLAHHLLARTAGRNARVLGLSPEAMRVLLSHSWPGNVRELENALEYATAVCKRQTVFPEDLPPTVHAQNQATAARKEPQGLDLAALRSALEENRWNRGAAARALGVSRTTLWRRMRELGLAA
jgi:transcriptional regulator with PAS, ATPase and Fis domain